MDPGFFVATPGASAAGSSVSVLQAANYVDSCLVCGSSSSFFVPAGIQLVRSRLSIQSFLDRNRVFPVGSSWTIWTSTDGVICNSCYGIVVNCDEWSFAFNQGIEYLKQRKAACLLSARAVSNERCGERVSRQQQMTGNSDGAHQPFLAVCSQQPGSTSSDHCSLELTPAVKQEAKCGDGSDGILSNDADQTMVAASSVRASPSIKLPEGFLDEPPPVVDEEMSDLWTPFGAEPSCSTSENEVANEDTRRRPGAGSEGSVEETVPSSPDPLKVDESSSGASEQTAAGKDDRKKDKGVVKEEVKKMCPICGEVVACGSFTAHYRAAHPGEKVRRMLSAEFLRCPSCPYKTRRKNSLAAHLMDKHDVYSKAGSGALKKCPRCEAAFKSEIGQENHRMKVHGEEGTFACSKCDRKFLSNFSRNAHEAQMHSTETRICEYCAEEVRIGLYNSHVNSRHKPKRTYTCEHCGVVRLSSRLLKQHLARAHGIGVLKKTGPPAKECSECGKKIGHVEHYHAHLFLQHGIETAGLKRYKCELCDEVLYVKIKYKNHLKLHTGVRHVCPDCGYQTRFSGNLHKHRVGVHGKKKEG